MGLNISTATAHHIQHGKGAIRNSMRKTGKIGSFTKPYKAAAADEVSKISNMIRLVNYSTQREMAEIRNMIALVNPQTQREMSSLCGMSLGTAHRVKANLLKTKRRKNCHVHMPCEA